MSADIDIPQTYWLNTFVSGTLDMDLDEIRVKEIAPITTVSTMKGDHNNPVVMHSDSKVDMQSNSKVDLGLDNIQITKLPRIDLQVSAKPTRVHFPVNYKVSFGSLGVELFSVNFCGESMVIIEDYFPHETEECE